jgi:hypothetical protein
VAPVLRRYPLAPGVEVLPLGDLPAALAAALAPPSADASAAAAAAPRPAASSSEQG